jgi:hypothetical protein
MPIILPLLADRGRADGLVELRTNKSAFRLRNPPPIALSGSIASPTFHANNSSQCVDGGAPVGMGIKPDSARCPDPAPMTHQQRAAKQVRPDLQPIVSPFVYFRSNARE